MFADRQWKTERLGRTGGLLRLGQRADWPELPVDAIVSITHGVNLNVLATLFASVINQVFILPPLRHNPDLLYAELHGDLLGRDTLTLTLWHAKGLTTFRDKGAHGWAKDGLTGFLFGGQATLWFLTYKPHDRRLPSASEARQLAETYGRMMHKGRYVRAATRPIQQELI